jgi:hypothetical protein
MVVATGFGRASGGKQFSNSIRRTQMINIQYIVKAQKEREAASKPKVVVTPTQKPKPQKDKAA